MAFILNVLNKKLRYAECFLHFLHLSGKKTLYHMKQKFNKTNNKYLPLSFGKKAKSSRREDQNANRDDGR